MPPISSPTASMKKSPSRTLGSGSSLPRRSRRPSSSRARSSHTRRNRGPASPPGGSSGTPRATAVASRVPLRPPALVPAITSTTTSPTSALRQRATHASNTARSCSATPPTPSSDSPAATREARRRRSISCVTPPIHTARLTPPLRTRARRTSCPERPGAPDWDTATSRSRDLGASARRRPQIRRVRAATRAPAANPLTRTSPAPGTPSTLIVRWPSVASVVARGRSST